MKVIKFKVWLTTGYSGASHHDTLEAFVDDDATQEEIDDLKKELTNDWVNSKIEFGYEE